MVSWVSADARHVRRAECLTRPLLHMYPTKLD